MNDKGEGTFMGGDGTGSEWMSNLRHQFDVGRSTPGDLVCVVRLTRRNFVYLWVQCK